MTTTIQLDEIVFFPTTVRHPETNDWIRIIDYTQPHEYLSGIYVYEHADTGEYGGTLLEHNGMTDSPPQVEIKD